MKKEFLILAAIFGLSFKSYASTGSSNDEGVLFLGVIGILLIILGIVSLIDYLKNNGKRLFYRTTSFLNKKVCLLKKYLKKVLSNFFNQTYSKFQL